VKPPQPAEKPKGSAVATTANLSANFFNNDADTDTLSTVRLQFVHAHFGLTGGVARAVAILGFGGDVS